MTDTTPALLWRRTYLRSPGRWHAYRIRQDARRSVCRQIAWWDGAPSSCTRPAREECCIECRRIVRYGALERLLV